MKELEEREQGWFTEGDFVDLGEFEKWEGIHVNYVS
jgi:hypothetical protein